MTSASLPAGGVDILMYHSVSSGPAPLSIAPQTFRLQMDLLARAGLRGLSLRDYLDASAGARPVPGVVLTFDDGYKDFVDVALPDIESRAWTCTVFLCSGLVGAAGWDPDGKGRRGLLDWSDARRLGARGVEIGAHSISHPDLTRLTSAESHEQIADSKRVLEARAECAVTSFAPPYGRTSAAIRAHIASLYSAAVGTHMARADADSDRFDLPRIDMWYFQNPRRWRRYLDGHRGYFALRRALRHGRLAFAKARR